MHFVFLLSQFCVALAVNVYVSLTLFLTLEPNAIVRPEFNSGNDVNTVVPPLPYVWLSPLLVVTVTLVILPLLTPVTVIVKETSVVQTYVPLTVATEPAELD